MLSIAFGFYIGIFDAYAGAIEIPIPEVQGMYSGEDIFVRHVLIRMNPAPAHIYGAQIRWSGEFTSGVAVCLPQDTIPWSATFLASMGETQNGGEWIAPLLLSSETSQFETTTSFQPFLNPTWDFLLDGEDTLTVTFAPDGFRDCFGVLAPWAVLDAAALIIDGEFPIELEVTTWGLIKSLFEGE